MIERILKFFQLVDRGSHLSITNISVIAVLGKILSADIISNADLIALGAVLANYGIKRFIVYLESKTPTPATIDVEALQQSLTKLTKDMDETKTKIQSLTIKAAIMPR